jgi:hypothetical protein
MDGYLAGERAPFPVFPSVILQAIPWDFTRDFAVIWYNKLLNPEQIVFFHDLSNYSADQETLCSFMTVYGQRTMNHFIPVPASS